MNLPDLPVVDIRSQQEPTVPEGSHDASSNSVSSFEVVTDIEHDLGAPCVLHLSKERVQLGMDDGCIRPLAAVSGKLQVDGRRQRHGIRGCHGQEVAGLY